MFKENLENPIEILNRNDELKNEGAAVLEAMKIEKTENGYLSEIDEGRIEEASEIMAEIFDNDVISNWSELSNEEKAEKFTEYQTRLGEAWGIEAKGVIFENMERDDGIVTYGYNSGDGYIHINEKFLDDPTQLKEMLDTTTHEMRHQFQVEVLRRPQDFKDIPKLTKLQWYYNFTHYKSTDEYSFRAYARQGIEVDARKTAEDVLNRYINKIQ